MSKCQPPWVAPLFNLDRDMRTRVLTNPSNYWEPYPGWSAPVCDQCGRHSRMLWCKKSIRRIWGAWGPTDHKIQVPGVDFRCVSIGFVLMYYFRDINHDKTTHIISQHSMQLSIKLCRTHDDVIKWKHFPRSWPFVRGIHRSPMNFPHKSQWRGALIFFLSVPG